MGPSLASTIRMTESTVERMRSTSPEKSACPGVSMMLMRYPPHSTVQGLERMVMPRSRSMAPESITRSATCVWALKV